MDGLLRGSSPVGTCWCGYESPNGSLSWGKLSLVPESGTSVVQWFAIKIMHQAGGPPPPDLPPVLPQ
ncbi:hypothetical protein GCM10022233_14440 [Streptomyces shaanxiensis]|uniref:Uncharacterized protein n=1 Tax=Streptomyces shaanxiensis TaxID=653357 RepID=A0ABP7UKN6_9ACTN